MAHMSGMKHRTAHARVAYQDADGALLARDGVKRVEHVVEHPGQLVTRQLVDEGEQVGDVADQDRDAHVRLHVRPARVRLRPLARRWHRHDCLAVAQDSVHFEIPELSHAQLDVDARVQLLHAERLPQVVCAQSVGHVIASPILLLLLSIISTSPISTTTIPTPIIIFIVTTTATISIVVVVVVIIGRQRSSSGRVSRVESVEADRCSRRRGPARCRPRTLSRST
eukprot:1933286-Rhodomonas_salina.1